VFNVLFLKHEIVTTRDRDEEDSSSIQNFDVGTSEGHAKWKWGQQENLYFNTKTKSAESDAWIPGLPIKIN
jgi:hypothetical protein